MIMRREGGWFRVHRAHHKLDTMETTGHVVRAREDVNAEPQIEQWVEIVVDEDGLGGGVLDRLRELEIDAAGFKNGAQAYNSEHFANRRAELYWALKDMFEAEEADIDPLDDQLAAQLGSIKWTLDSKGRIKIESKEDMKKRGMPSPDRRTP